MSTSKIAIKAIKIGLLGDTQVGKTAICRSFMNYEFENDILSTIGNIKLEKKYKLKNGEQIKLILWDSAGQERYRSVAMSTLKAVAGVILVFDVTNKDSFTNVSNWLLDIKEHLNNPCLILFANKIDMEKELWTITEEEIIEFANEKKLIYFKTSAKTKAGIDEGFAYIINDAYERIRQRSEEEEKRRIELKAKAPENKEKSGCFGKKKKKTNENTKK
jgi:small GTP-binding protein